MQLLKMPFFFIYIFGHHMYNQMQNMSNECLFVELKEVVNYAVSFFLQKTDELSAC